MPSSYLLTTLSLLSLPLSILAAPVTLTNLPTLYQITAGSVTPGAWIEDSDDTSHATKAYSLTIRGVNAGNIDIQCSGDATITYHNRENPPRVDAKLDCPADPNGNVWINVGNDQDMDVSVQWYGGEMRKGRTNYRDPATWTTHTPDGPGFNSWTLNTVLEP